MALGVKLGVKLGLWLGEAKKPPLGTGNGNVLLLFLLPWFLRCPRWKRLFDLTGGDAD